LELASDLPQRRLKYGKKSLAAALAAIEAKRAKLRERRRGMVTGVSKPAAGGCAV
jgi:hypothetical protein